MFADLRTGALGAEMRAQICVIGAGPAGITLALELGARGLDVILVESGGFEMSAETEALCVGENVGHPMALEDGRHRVLGGAAARWSGRCAALDPIDFEARGWVPLSGWPFGPETLSSYYGAAGAYCGFPAPWGEAAPVVAPPAFDERCVVPFFWRYAPQGRVRRYRDWGRDFRAALGQTRTVRVLLHANVTALNAAAERARVSSAEAVALNGACVRIVAEQFVLCCGGAENARLMLAAEESAPALQGTNPDMIGRCLMQHPRGRIAAIEASRAESERLQDLFNVFIRGGGVQYELGFALPEAVQRREGLLNCSAILSYDADPASPWERLKLAASGRAGGRLDDVGAVLGDAGRVARNLWRRGPLGRHAIVDARTIAVVADIEQAPDLESRLTLSNVRDKLGLRRLRADWRIGQLEYRTAGRFAHLLAGEFARLGLGALKPEAWATAAEDAPPAAALGGTYHHIGALRMAADPRLGVVNAECRVHGVENLYVQGSAVFPTGGHANPTLTIVALALRQADILARAAAATPRAEARIASLGGRDY